MSTKWVVFGLVFGILIVTDRCQTDLKERDTLFITFFAMRFDELVCDKGVLLSLYGRQNE